MALSSLRLSRTLKTTLSTLHRSLSATSVLSAPHSSSSSLFHAPTSLQSPTSPPQSWTLFLQSRPFRSSSLASARSDSYGGNNRNDEIDPDTILFEGCDYNHWLIVMDFGRDNKPLAEEMVKTYEETCAKGLGISVEEAKQKMYACSTTTYTGFQVVMSEAESEKFNGLPGVIFVLPDSYIDPQNKEYGGDKYINGTIIPRPPPVQYGRQARGRYGDGNRNSQRPRFDQQGAMPNQHGNPSYGQQMPMQGGGNYGASQNHPQQNYSPPGQGENKGHMPMNVPGGRDAYQPGRDPIPSYQGNYNQGWQRNSNPQEQRNFPQGDQRNYVPPGQGEFRGDGRNYGPPQAETYGQGTGEFQGRGTGRPFGQGPSPGAYGQGPSPGAYRQGSSPEAYGHGPSPGSYGQGQSPGAYGQGPNPGAYGQGPNPGAHGQGPNPGAHGQGPNPGAHGQGPNPGAHGQGPNPGAYGQSYSGHGEDQSFPQAEQRSTQG